MALDLFLESAPVRGRSEALFEQLREAITGGRLAPGERLPASRDLATELGLARSTVTTVYGRLVAEGYAEGRTGVGTFVADLVAPAPGRQDELAAVDAGIRPRRVGRPPAVAPSPPAGGWVADLRTGRPDPALFPVVDWRRCVLGALQSPPPGYGDRAGLPELRRVLAAWVKRSRGVEAGPGQVVVTAGAQGAFDLLARVLLGPGDAVAVENPGYRPAWEAFEGHGVELLAVPVDGDGLVVDDIPVRARAAYVTPSHQWATGAILSAARRRRLLDRMRAQDGFVIEDDYDTEFRYVDRPLEPLHRLDGTGRVVYVGSFSKTLTPSLRLGFIVAPEAVVEALVSARASVDTQPPHLTQAALAAFIAGGGFEKHLRRTRRVHRSRRELVVAHLERMRAGGLIAASAPCHAGLHSTVSLHPGHDPSTIVERLRDLGVMLDSTEDAWVGSSRPGLAIGFGLTDEAGLARGLDLLAGVLRGETQERGAIGEGSG